MKKKTLIYAFSFITCFVLMFGLLAPVVANAGTREDYRAAQQKLDAINKEISGIKNEKKKQQEQKNQAQTQANLVKNQISILNGNIAQTNADLEAKQQELDDKKVELANTEALFRERLKAMYMMRSNSGTLSTVLGANSFSELMTATDTLQRISVADTNLLKVLDQQRIDIEAEEQELQNKLVELETQHQNLEKKQTELAGFLKTINSKLSDTEAQQQAAEATQSEIYAEYQAAKQAFEAEIAQIGNSGSQIEYQAGDYIWPVPTRGEVSSQYGSRYLYGVKDFHTGIDIAKGSYSTIYGQAIVASKSGVVVRASSQSTGYGNCVMLDHGGGTYTLYGHCSSLAVTLGQTVSQGQVIAYVGNTGNSTGPHLHFEIRIGGSAMSNCVDPLPYVQGTRPAR